MNLNQFIQLFAEQFDETSAEVFTASTSFKNLDEWGSLVALSIISMIDEEFDKSITGSELRKVDTIEDLYNLIGSK